MIRWNKVKRVTQVIQEIRVRRGRSRVADCDPYNSLQPLPGFMSKADRNKVLERLKSTLVSSEH